jgi:hypothetical protein
MPMRFDECEWYYLDVEAQTIGPFTTEALEKMYCTASAGLEGINDKTMVWSEQSDVGWTSIGLYPGLKSVLLGEESESEVAKEVEDSGTRKGITSPQEHDMERV